MQVSVEVSEGLKRRIKVEVPADRVDSEIKSRLKNLSHRVKVAGFRQGKVPMKVVESQYGQQVRMEVVGELMQSTLYEALAQEDLKPAGAPQVEPLSMEPGESLQYAADFEVMPEITLASMNEVTIEKPACEIGEADIDDMLETLKKQRATWKEVDAAANDGDQVVIDFDGKIDGVAFEGGKASDAPLVLGSKSFIPGFEEQLEGTKAGDDVKVKVSFPDDYHGKDVAGKKAVFDVKVKKVLQAELPEIDEDLIKSFGIASGNMDDFRAELEKNMQRELTQRIKDNIKSQITNALMEKNSIDIPSSLTNSEAQRMLQQMQAQAGTKTELADLPDSLRESLNEQANRRVSLGLIFAEIAKVNNLTVSPDKVRAYIEEIAQSYEDPQEVINHYYSNRNNLSGIESIVLEEEVVDWVLGQTKVEEVKKSFTDLVSAGKN
ncbi:MAG: trigger factor [Gammaproteobacteria bacterium]|nr:trigger factor [Gammaproteobacteria bacterium]MDH5613505.1 trigger factor [Gammaproteobacteria bacterium]